jgi:hypothetical protein
MASVIARTGVKRQKGYLYFINKAGDVAKVQMARSGKKTSKKQEVVAKARIKRRKGYLYFVDKNGNVCEAKMARGRK